MKAVNVSAMHNASTRHDPPKCHPGTRRAILERIRQWIFGSDDNDALILWLYGPAGSGKSAILQSIAEQCAELEILLASFIFSRYDCTRNHPSSLISTIAYQIATRIGQVTPALEAAIGRDPIIFEKSIDTQIDTLIIGPLKYLIKTGYFEDKKLSPRLVLIDGLDECNQEDHRRAVLRAIARAIRVHNLPFIFLISSRPEAGIKFTFNFPELANLWTSLALDRSYAAYSDIRLFLNDSFNWIRNTHPMKEHIPLTWPTPLETNTLVTKSSGQFIYASTVVKYVSIVLASPPKQLDTILGVRPPRSGDVPFAEMDALYTHILSSVREKQLMLDILALLTGCFDFKDVQSPSNISRFLGVDQEDIDIVLSSLESLVHRSSVYSNTGPTVQLSHVSLNDFLGDPKRSGEFYLDKMRYRTKLVPKGIK